ncbi:rod shape-determining protein MreD [Deinococcus arenae]|uniref:Rod shape-determining protein MreD n=1 Tax=Deinococcus arenae TaxID=1452751 RepID=A0A8H9GKU8_9DEIO|nr:rod shape-determining protein MreD [Deinococcus arenae]AWT35323.1 rod shape-determining protein MreD [Deinococcus actinosclerus]GGM35775.1 rod shape-determining protein MreD [Deinococcus arenae]
MRRPAGRGSGRWARLIVYLLLLVAAQGLLSRLLDGAGVPAPDLFLLTAVGLAARVSPVAALLAAYGLGFTQDVLGGGMLGLHAAGLTGGALLVVWARRYLSDAGLLQSLLGVLLGVAGQWLVFLFLTYWLREPLVTVSMLTGVAPLVFVGTFLLSVVWERLIAWTFGPRVTVEEQLA